MGSEMCIRDRVEDDPTLVTENFCLGVGREGKGKGRRKGSEGERKDPHSFLELWLILYLENSTFGVIVNWSVGRVGSGKRELWTSLGNYSFSRLDVILAYRGIASLTRQDIVVSKHAADSAAVTVALTVAVANNWIHLDLCNNCLKSS